MHATWAAARSQVWKKFRLGWDLTPWPLRAGAVLYQVSYQVNWGVVILWIHVFYGSITNLQNERKSKHGTLARHTKKWYLTPRSHMVHFRSWTTRCVISFALIMLTWCQLISISFMTFLWAQEIIISGVQWNIVLPKKVTSYLPISKYLELPQGEICDACKTWWSWIQNRSLPKYKLPWCLQLGFEMWIRYFNMWNPTQATLFSWTHQLLAILWLISWLPSIWSRLSLYSSGKSSIHMVGRLLTKVRSLSVYLNKG